MSSEEQQYIQQVTNLAGANHERSIQAQEAAFAGSTAVIVAPDGNGNGIGVHAMSKTPEWYTPADIVARVCVALGQIDLDPCSNTGTPNIPAMKRYTRQDNGLEQGWEGRVYMNPPYGDEIGVWVAKLAWEFQAGNVTEAIALVPARTDTAWFRTLRKFPKCFIYGRLKFLSPTGTVNSAPFPSVAVYLGTDLARFANTFREIGDIYTLLEDQ
jgi:hypothetical protein